MVIVRSILDFVEEYKITNDVQIKKACVIITQVVLISCIPDYKDKGFGYDLNAVRGVDDKF